MTAKVIRPIMRSGSQPRCRGVWSNPLSKMMPDKAIFQQTQWAEPDADRHSFISALFVGGGAVRTGSGLLPMGRRSWRCQDCGQVRSVYPECAKVHHPLFAPYKRVSTLCGLGAQTPCASIRASPVWSRLQRGNRACRHRSVCAMGFGAARRLYHQALTLPWS